MTQAPAPGWRPAWFSTPPAGPSTAAERLARELRALNELLVQGGAEEATLDALALQAEAMRGRLSAAATPLPAHPDAERRLDRASPVTGLANVAAPPVRIWVDGEIVHGTATFGAAFEGPPGHVHGGVIAAAFDEVLGATQSLAEQGGMTGTLTVRYRRPTPLHREVEFRGRLERVSGRKLLTSATLHAGDVLCAEAEAVFVAVDFATLAARRHAPAE